MSFFTKLFSSISSSGAARSGRVVGIDIGSSSMKVVELEQVKDVLTLTTYGELQLGPYAAKEVGESVLIDPKKEQQALVDLLRESAVKAKQAVFAVPLSASFVTVMSLQAQKNEDLSSRIRVEARKYIPTQVSEVTLDWAEIEGGSSASIRDVLVAAIQNDSLRRYENLLSFVGFTKSPSEIECFSAVRSVASETDEHVAIIDVGALSSKLYITKSGLLRRMHRVRAGGAVATKRIAEVLGKTFGEAEQIKRSTVSSDATYADVVKAHRSCFDRSFVEFRQVIDEYEKTFSTTITKVYVTGGGVLFSPVISQFKEVLQKEVVRVEPFAKVAYPAFMDDMLQEIGPTFNVAVGAALRAYD